MHLGSSGGWTKGDREMGWRRKGGGHWKETASLKTNIYMYQTTEEHQ